MSQKNIEKLETLQETVKQSNLFAEEEKSIILEKIQEWRHEDEAMNLIPKKLAEISEKMNPILDELGFL